jgi:hypothetical protein
MPAVSGNLEGMDIDNDHRIAVVKAWREARAHGQDQASFCARQVPPIKPRTLRLWMKTVGRDVPDTAAGSDINLIFSALANMKALADQLERNRLGRAPPGMPIGKLATGAKPGPPMAPETIPEPDAEAERHDGIETLPKVPPEAEEPAAEALATVSPPALPATSGDDEKPTSRARAAAFWDE